MYAILFRLCSIYLCVLRVTLLARFNFFEYWDVQPLNSVVFSDEWQPIIRFKLFTPFVYIVSVDFLFALPESSASKICSKSCALCWDEFIYLLLMLALCKLRQLDGQQRIYLHLCKTKIWTQIDLSKCYTCELMKQSWRKFGAFIISSFLIMIQIKFQMWFEDGAVRWACNLFCIRIVLVVGVSEMYLGFFSYA